MNQDAGVTGPRTNQQDFHDLYLPVRHLKTGFVELLRSEELAAWFSESAPLSDLTKPARRIEDLIAGP